MHDSHLEQAVEDLRQIYLFNKNQAGFVESGMVRDPKRIETLLQSFQITLLLDYFKLSEQQFRFWKLKMRRLSLKRDQKYFQYRLITEHFHEMREDKRLLKHLFFLFSNC